jgi:predicted nucleic acid-binding protein
MNDESTATRVVVDASLWVASLVPQDAFYTISQKWLQQQRLQGVELFVPALMLTEVAGVISRQTRDPRLAHEVVETLKELPGVTLVEMNYTLVQYATDLAARLGLRGADAYYVSVAVFLGLPLATFDQDQSSRAQTVLSGVIVPA